MSDVQDLSPVAWYRQFWPWFLVALPLAAVLGGLLTLFLAASNPDLLIQRSDDERIGPVIFESINRDRAQHND
jgi:hypothetical protein